MILSRMILAAAIAAVPLCAQAQTVVPPCGMPEKPAFPRPGPQVEKTILDGDGSGRWTPPACTGWPSTSRSQLVIGIAGSFRSTEPVETLLTRLGAISQLPKVRYWSQHAGEWRPIAVAASALSNQNASSRRADFAQQELLPRTDHYFWENDSRAGEIVYKITVRERGADRAVATRENVTAITQFPIITFNPGATQSAIFLVRREPDIWGVYILERVTDGARSLVGIPKESIVNHDSALFRYIAKMQTDRDPPPFQ
jgi:hypothetical protein